MSSQAFSGWVRPPPVDPTPTPSAGAVSLNVSPSGAINGTNQVFSCTPSFTDIALYLNGVRLLIGADFTSLADPVGPGYNRVVLTVAPEGGATPDILSAELVAA